jgi:murein DD-endopeptidase MepM/ murein hydrolase activator NlpD
MALSVAAALLLVPATSAGARDLVTLRAEIADLQREIAAEERRMAGFDSDIADLVREIERTEARRERIIDELSARVGAAYRYGVSDVSTAAILWTGQDPVELADSIAKLDVVNNGDVSAEQDAARLADELKGQEAELAKAKGQQEQVLERLWVKKQNLASQIRVQETLYGISAWGFSGQDLGPVPTGAPMVRDGMACPVSTPYQFIDSYGAPRSGGRSHKGVDMFAPHGSPLYAVESGVVARSRSNGLGGLYIWLVGDSGNEYYYAHNSANLVPAGTRVSAGQVVARLGNTGNASGHPSHLHFEVHPGGGSAVNPYPLARQLCP